MLLVDDSSDGREMLATALRGYGARVQAVASADDTLRILKEEQVAPDVIVSDIGMAGVDGYELIRRVRELGDRGRHLPAIAVTAYANPEDRIRALAAGYQLHAPNRSIPPPWPRPSSASRRPDAFVRMLSSVRH